MIIITVIIIVVALVSNEPELCGYITSANLLTTAGWFQLASRNLFKSTLCFSLIIKQKNISEIILAAIHHLELTISYGAHLFHRVKWEFSIKLYLHYRKEQK